MGNMTYCQFQNTLPDLRDCYDNWDVADKTSEDEKKARKRLLELCKQIVEEYGDDN